MPLPAIMDIAQRHLFDDRDKMLAQGIPVPTIEHVIRLRDVYNFWLTFPSKKDREIRQELMKRGGISMSQAYEDIRIIKSLLGEFQRTTKDYHRYRFLEMIRSAYDKAAEKGDARSMAAAAAQYAKYTQLDKDDDRDKGYDRIVPQKFTFTDDPEVIGIKRLPDHREKIRKTKEQYWSEDITDIDFEIVDNDPDELFKPKPNDRTAGKQ